MHLATDHDRICHLLRRFGLGASEAEVSFYEKGGLSGAIDKLINFEQVPQGFVMDIERLEVLPNANAKVKILRPRATQLWWYTNILTTQRPLEQKMTIFWHNHFATSAEKVDSGEAMYQHIETLRKNAFGRFEDLLLAISHDPAMLYWLDNGDNVKGKPNENFAREVMELFTLGVGHYSEKDVQEGARAFTGWRYGTARPDGRVFPTKQIPKKSAVFIFMPGLHDGGSKNFLANQGDFNGEDICGILVGQEQTSKFLVKKIWEWFVYPNPEEDLVGRLASVWRSKGLEVRTLLRMIMESPEFYSDKAAMAIVKNPIDFAVSSMRQLGVGQLVAQMAASDTLEGAPKYVAPAAGLLISTKAMGMELVYPPDVSGWRIGNDWISTATMLERMKWSDQLFLNKAVDLKGKGKPVRRPNNFPSAGVLAGTPEPAAAARKLASIFDAKLPEEKMAQLERAAADAAGGGQVTAQNAHLVAAAVSKLIFGSPEFQFC